MPRRSLDDDIYGDRHAVRSHRAGASASGAVLEFDFTGGPKAVGSRDYGAGFGASRCYEKHPPLILPGDAKWQIFGGSCSSPIVSDADVYIGFDWSMRMTSRSWPWKKGTEFLFEIKDMTAPSNPAEFKKLVAWTIKQLEAGAKIHAGCIGGHGRTGTFLAAVVAELGEQDAVTYVRKNYCHKAVESSAQVDFLVAHFGVSPVPGHKQHDAYGLAPKTKGSKKVKGPGRAGALSSGSRLIEPLSAANPDRIW